MTPDQITVAGLAAVTNPITETIKAVRATVGAWYQPHQTRRNAQADADAFLIKKRSELEGLRLETIAGAERELYMLSRLVGTETQRQANIEAIVDEAVRRLEGKVIGKIPGYDWGTAFIDECKDIGDPEVQNLWSQILAGEMERQGTYTRRFLAALKLFSKAEAVLFTEFLSYVWGDPLDEAYYLKTPDTDRLLEHEGFNRNKLFELSSLGLIKLDQEMHVTIANYRHLMQYQNRRFYFGYTRNGTTSLAAVFLTSLGKQLMTLCKPEPSESYLKTYSRSVGFHIEETSRVNDWIG